MLDYLAFRGQEWTGEDRSGHEMHPAKCGLAKGNSRPAEPRGRQGFLLPSQKCFRRAMLHLRVQGNAHRSNNATMHANNTRTMHGKSGTHVAKSHAAKTNATRGIGHRSSSFSRSHGMRSMGHMRSSHGMRSMGHMSGSHGMGSMGHGGGHRR